MTGDIVLKIYMPETLVLDKPIHRAVLPFDDKTLTIIKDRAPTLAVLDMGVLKVLDENNQPIEEWLIAGGVADVKEDVCSILTEAAYNKAELNLEKVKEMNAEFCNPFFQWMVDYFEHENKPTKR